MTSGAVAGASLSSLATPVFMAIVLAVAHWPLLIALSIPLAFSGVVAGLYGALYTYHLNSRPVEALALGRAFELRQAVLLALMIGVVLVVSTALVRGLGSIGAVAGIALAGFADAHAAGASAGALAARAELSVGYAAVATLIAISGNAVVKVIVSWVSGGGRFALRILPGQVLVVAALWSGWWLWRAA
jgi:uncharacterized membrane protein (DUF4010 family)